MNRQHWKYVLIGGGMASSAAAVAIRQADREGSLLLVGQEVHRPYHRPRLSHDLLCRSQIHPELFTLDADWFVHHHVALRTGRRATQLDTARHGVMLDSGEEIAFEKLLIATGGVSRPLQVPGAELPSVYTLRTIDDAQRLHNAIEQARREGKAHERGRGRALVVGTGLLAVELAATLTELGLAVDMLGNTPWPYPRIAGETTGRLMARFLGNHGVKWHGGTVPLRLEGAGRVQQAIASDGQTHACDLVVSAIGMVPHKQLLRGAPLTAEKAILVDGRCRTNVPDIYAAGDCAAILDPLFGKYRLLDHWESAVAMGTVAGKNMAGVDAQYSGANHFASRAFDLELSAWGEGRLVERRIIRGTQNPDAPDFVEIGVDAEGRVAQVLALGHRGEDHVLRELVARRIVVNGAEGILRDPEADLSQVLGTAER